MKGSLVLVGGAPGVGKSTLMLQICGSLCKKNRVLYVSGEESVRQLKLRAQRLGVTGGNLLVLSETALEDVLQSVSDEEPDVLIVDSIQTLYNGALESPPGSIGQVKDCTMALMQLAKGKGVTVFVIGHVNKERPRTGSGPPTRSASSRCWTPGWRRWRTPPRCSSRGVPTGRPGPALPA